MKLYRRTGEQFRPTFEQPRTVSEIAVQRMAKGVGLILLAAVILYLVAGGK